MSLNENAPAIAVVILAAGKGTRMKSNRAKVLHEICGRSLLGHVLEAATGLGPEKLCVVVGNDAEKVQAAFAGRADFVLQAEQHGTGHAVLMTQPKLGDFEGDVLILYADTPLLRSATLAKMVATKRDTNADLVMLTAYSENIPGRVVRGADGRVERIVEKQDATEEELAIEERNTGVYLIASSLLWEGIATLDPSNEQGELYITDVVAHAVATGRRVEALVTDDDAECMGINTRAELADAAWVMRQRINLHHMAEGVTLVDPETVYIDADVQIGRDTVIDPGCVITGPTVIGEGCHLKAGCVIEESRLDDEVTIGPCAHLRPKSHLMQGVKIGNFVEIKNATMGPGSKSAHLTYIGDATVGEEVNFGCGSVVVNYDGYEKHHTTVGDHAFIGCNANLVAPVRIEPHAFVSAGSTVTVDVPEDALAVARTRQRNIEGWVARKEGRPYAHLRSVEPQSALASADEPAAAAPEKKKTRKKGPSAGKAAKSTRKRVTSAGKKATKKKAGKKAVRKKTGKNAGKKAGRKKAAGKKAGAKKAARKKAGRRRT